MNNENSWLDRILNTGLGVVQAVNPPKQSSAAPAAAPASKLSTPVIIGVGVAALVVAVVLLRK